MDFQSAMETFAEAWVAANTKVDPVQSQALALTHKATPPSRSSSVSPIPRSPQSQQTAHTTNRSPTPRPASVQHPQLVHQPSQQQSNLISASVAQQPSRTEHQHQHHQHQHQHQQQPQLSQAFGIHHNRHTKQEVDSSSPKPEGFDLSKNSSVTGKSPVPVHCIVESIHSIVDNRINLREKWPSPHIEIDTYVIIPASVPFQDLVGEALVRLGYPTDMIPSARGSIIVKNWRPLPMESVADEPTPDRC